MRLYATAAAATVALFLLATIQTTPAAAEEQEETSVGSTAEAITEPPIKLVHVLNPGEREYLSPNLIGVQNIAMTFLPLSMNFVNIIDAYREIVNGVRYEILLNAVDTKAKDADTICRLVILEQPWITTQWGDKHRELINSNCSDVSDNALPIDSEQRSKALNDKYVSNSIFNGGKRNELSDSEMATLEAQILTSFPSGASGSSSSSSKRRFTTTTTTISPSTVSESTNESATSISVNEAAAAAVSATVSATATAPATASATDAADDSAPVSTTAVENSSTTITTAELNDNEKRWLDDFLSVGAYNFEKTIEQQRLELKQQQQQVEQQQEKEEQYQQVEVEQEQQQVQQVEAVEEQQQQQQEQQQQEASSS